MNKDYYLEPTNWYWLLLLGSAGLFLLLSGIISH